MEVGKLKDRYSEDKLNEVRDYLRALEIYLDQSGKNFETCSSDDLENYMDHLISVKQNSLERLIAIARYFYDYDYPSLYIFMTGVLGGVGVIASINSKSKAMNQDLQLEVPDLGLTPSKLFPPTRQMVKEISRLDKDVYREILADNHHQIPRESILTEKTFYESSISLEAYLYERHKRKVQELQDHCDSGKVWFEQVISQEIVDYVSSNQEILSGVYKDGYIYITKFPYKTEAVLHAECDLFKRYHYCHCPYAKESILSDEPVDSEWCYCSAGFAKFPFEVILDRPLKIELLESVLRGDLRCRFRIRLERACQ
ncbi:hypothetical protein EZV73_23410 [Acidaminobacter sp. JC074]|uniref:DUF6144 family protein n=1 Tax=Acidaminobacter sp. JC074 TaxID=2530199 RepID=UPI001F0E8540|nr:DUF6144 family protein [Acidaminobacter sp. JC074]MCH4890549.1 hypothetical protein [Acidaminobacter sp. JC074]